MRFFKKILHTSLLYDLSKSTPLGYIVPEGVSQGKVTLL